MIKCNKTVIQAPPYELRIKMCILLFQSKQTYESYHAMCDDIPVILN